MKIVATRGPGSVVVSCQASPAWRNETGISLVSTADGMVLDGVTVTGCGVGLSILGAATIRDVKVINNGFLENGPVGGGIVVSTGPPATRLPSFNNVVRPAVRADGWNPLERMFLVACTPRSSTNEEIFSLRPSDGQVVESNTAAFGGGMVIDMIFRGGQRANLTWTLSGADVCGCVRVCAGACVCVFAECEIGPIVTCLALILPSPFPPPRFDTAGITFVKYVAMCCPMGRFFFFQQRRVVLLSRPSCNHTTPPPFPRSLPHNA